MESNPPDSATACEVACRKGISMYHPEPIFLLFTFGEFLNPGYIFGALYFAYSVYMMLNPKQWDNLGHAAHLGGATFGLVYAVATEPEVAFSNIYFLGVMSLPLLYMAYQIFVKKRIG